MDTLNVMFVYNLLMDTEISRSKIRKRKAALNVSFCVKKEKNTVYKKVTYTNSTCIRLYPLPLLYSHPVKFTISKSSNSFDCNYVNYCRVFIFRTRSSHRVFVIIHEITLAFTFPPVYASQNYALLFRLIKHFVHFHVHFKNS